MHTSFITVSIQLHFFNHIYYLAIILGAGVFPQLGRTNTASVFQLSGITLSIVILKYSLLATA